MARGLFITVEGGEGAGKSTQAVRLAERLRAVGRAVIVTREPGGSKGGEEIRKLLITGEVGRWSATTETLLMYAARRDHIERVIDPALEKGQVVICDRFFDSTRAYQGAGGGASSSLVDSLETEVVTVRPDLTVILDLAPEEGLARVDRRAEMKTRFESRNLSFHIALRSAFLDIAREEPERCVVIDAGGSVDAVAADIWRRAEALL